MFLVHANKGSPIVFHVNIILMSIITDIERE